MRTGNFFQVFTWIHTPISLEFIKIALILIAATTDWHNRSAEMPSLTRAYQPVVPIL